MSGTTIRIGTRGSDLALWQARHVQALLEGHFTTELVIIETKGDVTEGPLRSAGGSAFFTAEIERALAEGEVDLAVHSHKDLETSSPPQLAVAAVLERASVKERLLVRPEALDRTAAFVPLKEGATVGTSSPRRQSALAVLRADLHMAELRGNVPTRVQRCVEGRYDAILLAAAGLDRLGLDTGRLITHDVPSELLVPAPAQGAIALQVRATDRALVEALQQIVHHRDTAEAVAAERTLLVRLGGGCHLPLGAWVRRGDGDVPAFRADVFLGADLPVAGRPARWVRAEGASPVEAVDRAWDLLQDEGPTGCGPLAGLRVVLTGSSAGPSDLGGRLTQLGASVSHEKVLAFQSVKAPDLPARLARLGEGDVIAITSQEAARRLKGEKIPSSVTIAAVGPATAKALASVGFTADVVGKGGAAQLADKIEVGEGGRVLFPCAEGARRELVDALAARGVAVDQVVLYKTVSDGTDDLVSDADVRVYMSPSAVASSVALGREVERSSTVRVGIGGTTCDALQDEGLSHERPQGSGPEATLDLLVRLHGQMKKRRRKTS